MPNAPAVIRPLTPADIPQWDLMAHQSSDELVKELIADPAVFYEGFDLYMEAKVRQGEAFMAQDSRTGRCMGIVAFSRKNNAVTFLGFADRADLGEAGSLLLTHAIGQLDPSRSIQSTVLKSAHPLILEERRLYKAHGFAACGDTIEAGVAATVMELPAR